MPGQAIEIGRSVLVVLRQSSDFGPRRLWSHSYFQNRLLEECERAVGTEVAPSVIRVRLQDATVWNDVLPVLVTGFPPPHLLAAYGPAEYEVLITGKTYGEAQRMFQLVREQLTAADIGVRLGFAAYPRDGLTVEALVGEASAKLRESERADAGPIEALSSSMSPVRELAQRAAQSNINILLLGETGVGKEVMTKFIHANSPRADKQLVSVNCASIQENLLESELFGHERGAFTGAVHAKLGILEAAEGGTVFLDEIGELPLLLQAKLLRVLEAKEVTRVGALRPRPIDVRFIAATNRDLEREASEGRFRQDLFFRLSGFSLRIPPLRERRAEIALLARKFLADISRDLRRSPALQFSDAALAALERFDWPGNIRELKNAVERAAVLCRSGQIEPEHLPADKFDTLGVARKSLDDRARRTQPIVLPRSGPPGQEDDVPGALGLDPLQLEERALIVDALNRCAGNQTRVAELLGMPRRTLVFKLKAYRIPRPRGGRSGGSSADNNSRG